MSEINFFDVVFFIIGIILLLFSLYVFADTKNAIKNSVEANGTLEKLENNKYVIVFQTEDGREIQSYSLYNNFIKSETVSIFYDKENPEEVKINSFIFLWGIPTLTSIIALILILMIIPKFVIRNL
jgi:hypothetical protein